MQRRWIGMAAGLLVVLWAGGAQAQIPVTDAGNMAQNLLHTYETITQAYEDLQQYRRQIDWAVKRIENPVWRDFIMRRTIDEALDAIRQGESIPYAIEAAGAELRHALPGPFPLNGREFTADILLAHWARRTRDTMSGGLQSASVMAGDYNALLEDLAKLKERANIAKGQGEDLHVANQYNAVVAGELAKMHQQLAVLINVETVGRAYELTREASGEATTRAWIAGELLLPGEVEDPYADAVAPDPFGG